MDIIFQGSHSKEEFVHSLKNVLELFADRYQINRFREIRCTVTLVDNQGEDVELMDSETGYVYRLFEAHREEHELLGRRGKPLLKLVVNNTR